MSWTNSTAACREAGRIVEAQRLKTRTEYDLEMMEEIGYCSGIENYSRHLSDRIEGERPSVLLDYFPPGFITMLDESHVTLPQIGAMYEGDRSRGNSTLVNHGFRLPSALDNRPLIFWRVRTDSRSNPLCLRHSRQGGAAAVDPVGRAGVSVRQDSLDPPH